MYVPEVVWWVLLGLGIFAVAFVLEWLWDEWVSWPFE